MQLEPGAKIGSKYRVTRILGEGGMGLVYEARHESLGTNVAIKILRDEVMQDREAVERFAREARAAAILRGPNAARILDVGEAEGGRPFMVMELLEGNDLGEELERRGTLPVLEAVDYVTQACDAIAEAHGLGIVHRDLKPANMFLVRVAGRRIVKVLDFGISRFDGASEIRVTQTQTAFGTPLYMSPEALRSAKHTDERADVWAFGIILYELLTGLPPFIGETPTAVAIAVTVETPKPISLVRNDVPPELEAIIAKALDKDKSRRYQNARELSEALHKLIADVWGPASLGNTHASLIPADPLGRPPLAAAAQSQVLPATTRTGEPLSSSVRREGKGRIAIVASVAIAAFAATLSIVAVTRSKRGPDTTAKSASDTKTAHVDEEPAVRNAATTATIASTTDTKPDASTATSTPSSTVTTSSPSTPVHEPSTTATSSSPPAPSSTSSAASPHVVAPTPPPPPPPPPPNTGPRPGGNPLTL